jgi:radical SAM superfamily enzyme YgiQ (UPF0313 family)
MTLAMLAAVLKEEGFSVNTAVNTFRKPLSIEDFVSAAKKCNANIVGISMLTFQVLFVYELIRALKKEGFKVVVGGSHATDCPEELVRNGADIVVRNEGEVTLRELCKFWNGKNDIPLEKIKGITFRNSNREVISTEMREGIDLAELPKPDLEVFDLGLFRGEDGFIKGFQRIYTSRGCPGRCTFCDWQVFKQNMRFYPVSIIIDEIKRRVDNYGITSFSIADDCFTINKKRVLEFCDGIGKIRPKVVWRANSRANLVDAEMLKAMQEAGCHSVAFGFESGDPETLIRIKKGVRLEHNIKAPFLAAEAGLQVYGCLMIGFPWERPQSVENNIKFIHKTWDAVSLFQVSGALMPFPGTEIYREYAAQYGFLNYWLDPKYQHTGIQIYQNVQNALAISAFYQRYLFDDTYIQEETFFNYSKEYKQKVKEMVLEIGKHNLLFMFKDKPLQQKFYLVLAKLSMAAYSYFPNLEKGIGGKLFHLFNRGNRRPSIEQLRDKRRGIVKDRKIVEIGSRLPGDASASHKTKSNILD